MTELAHALACYSDAIVGHGQGSPEAVRVFERYKDVTDFAVLAKISEGLERLGRSSRERNKMSSVLAFYPPPSSVLAEASYLLGYLNSQPFDRQKSVHAATNIINYANSMLPGTPDGALAVEEEVTLTANLMRLAPPDGAFTIPPMWKAMIRQLADMLLNKFLS